MSKRAKKALKKRVVDETGVNGRGYDDKRHTPDDETHHGRLMDESKWCDNKVDTHGVHCALKPLHNFQ